MSTEASAHLRPKSGPEVRDTPVDYQVQAYCPIPVYPEPSFKTLPSLLYPNMVHIGPEIVLNSSGFKESNNHSFSWKMMPFEQSGKTAYNYEGHNRYHCPITHIHCRRRWKADSKLKLICQTSLDRNPEKASLYETGKHLCKQINDRNMIDPGNPKIIICDSIFLKVFEKRAIWIGDFIPLIHNEFQTTIDFCTHVEFNQRSVPPPNRSQFYSTDTMVQVEPAMANYLGINTIINKRSYYKLFFSHLFKSELNRFSTQNVKVMTFNMFNDPLYTIFKCKALHASQITEKLHLHCTPIKSDLSMDMKRELEDDCEDVFVEMSKRRRLETEDCSMDQC